MKKYNAKILLFGEYSLLLGSNALVIPFSRFSGSLIYETYPGSEKSNYTLRLLLDHIEKIHDKLHLKLDINRLQKDVNAGMSFKSTIPVNYGLGNSGAICAAIYDQYTKSVSTVTGKDLLKIKEDLALIESYFHRKSSGSNPLTSYFNKPLIISQTLIQTTKLKEKLNTGVFLIDTLNNGNTSNPLTLFKQKWEDQGFLYKMMNDYIPLNNACIEAFLHNKPSLNNDLFDLSLFQYENFKEMIPNGIKNYWKEGLQNDIFSLKLCGSEGGGFMLGFTTNIKDTMEYFNLKVVPMLQLNLSVET